MSLLSKAVTGYLENGSWIRRIFESGIELKKQYGVDAVCDFSLGNPDLPAPAIVAECLAELAQSAGEPFALGYMPNAGHLHVREALAAELSLEQEMQLSAKDILLSCGAAGGLNAVFRTILDAGDEVVCPAPYFVEYGFYCANHGGVLRPAKPVDGFRLDAATIEAAITAKTRAVLINSPNNPTGVIYSETELRELADMLRRVSAKMEKPILLISDEPYRFLTYEGERAAPVMPFYEHSVVVSSFSKNMSLAGERVGYVIVNPGMPDGRLFMDGLIFSNRILGYVNAPVLGQAILMRSLGHGVDASIYASRRKAMAKVLTEAGYEFVMPKGAFYFFPKAPGGDDVAFVNLLVEERVLAVPGTGFGCPGFFRLAYCVGEEIINRALPGLTRARRRILGD